MNKTQREIFEDLTRHPASTITEIAVRVFCTPRTVYGNLRRMGDYVVEVQKGRACHPALWSVRQDVSWCPRCGQVME